MKGSIRSALSHKLSVRAITILVALVIGVLFIPYFHSLTTWAVNREIAFEDGSVALPTRWTNEGDGHLRTSGGQVSRFSFLTRAQSRLTHSSSVGLRQN